MRIDRDMEVLLSVGSGAVWPSGEDFMGSKLTK